MLSLKRRLYQLILRLHPAAFRNRFAREMSLDFEDALATYGFPRLLADATRSLLRQWTTAPAFSASQQPALIPSRPLLAGQYMVLEGDPLTPFELLRGSLLFAVLFFFIGLAFNAGGSHIIRAIHQSLPDSHDGGLGINPGHPTHPTTAAGVPRHEAEPDYSQILVIPAPYAPTRLYGRFYQAGALSLKHNPHIRRIREESWAEFFTRCALITVIVWLISFLLRRSRTILMRSILITLGLFGVTLSAAASPTHIPSMHAQLLHSDGPLPTFEVATVRLHPPSAPLPPVPFSIDPAKTPGPPKFAPGRGGAQATDRVHTILPARMIVAFAYDVPAGFENRYILGGPAWLDSDVYEITAKIDDATFAAMQKLPVDQQRGQISLMEQALLTDRFHLKAHFETRSLPAFALTLAKGGPRLAPSQPGETTRLAMQGDTITATALTLDQLLRSPFLGSRTILNQTGLSGAYDFTLTYSNRTDAASDDNSTSPALTTAVQNQLGLKLTPTRAPIEVLVIDSIDRPSEN